jgi:MerR family redox-sensitive transcriptional activator SoxR
MRTGRARRRRGGRAQRSGRLGAALLRGRRVAFIRASQGVGIPLRRIKAALDQLPDRRTPARRDWQRQSEDWRSELDDQISRLQRLRDNLSGCIGCGCLSLNLCRLVNPDDLLGRQGPGPRKL